MKADIVCAPGSTFGTVMLPENDPFDGGLGTVALIAVPLSMEKVATVPGGNPEPVMGICCPTKPWVCAIDADGRRKRRPTRCRRNCPSRRRCCSQCHWPE